MHCVYLADLAAVLSTHGPAILYRRQSISPQAVTQYWTSSRTRLELWHGAIARYQRAEHSGDWVRMRAWWRDHIGVLEEILVSELLTRVVAALAAGLDRNQDDEELSPITHAIFLSHLETRNRVQHLMLFGRGSSVQNAVRLNRLRKGVERWNDALLGRLWSSVPTEIRYAIDADRARNYAEDARCQSCGDAQRTSDWLLAAAMHDTLSRRSSPTVALPQANRQVADSVLLMLRPELFDSVGTMKSLWMHRMQFDCERTNHVLDDLLACRNGKDGAPKNSTPTHHSFDRW